MICPNSKIGIRFEPDHSGPVYCTDHLEEIGYDIAHGSCPECDSPIVVMRRGRYVSHYQGNEALRELVGNPQLNVLYPPGACPRDVQPEVPESYRNDFLEASRVLAPSPKASAAISRRLLQRVLREHFKITGSSLADEIDQFLNRPGVPSELSDAVDAVRNVGNFAAHPMKNTNTGEILEVEPGEAEWLIEVLESMFDFAFVQPKRLRARRASLNHKLAEAGKPPMK